MIPAQTHARRARRSSMIGATIEWHDYLLQFTAAAPVFGPLIFAAISAAAGVLASLATLTVGFVVRPLGGIAFGHFGDRRTTGRRVLPAVRPGVAIIASIPRMRTRRPARRCVRPADRRLVAAAIRDLRGDLDLPGDHSRRQLRRDRPGARTSRTGLRRGRHRPPGPAVTDVRP